MKIIKEYAWIVYLGFILGITGIDFRMWKFYIILVPVAILVEWSKYKEHS
jgi:hypothetical protein